MGVRMLRKSRRMAELFGSSTVNTISDELPIVQLWLMRAFVDLDLAKRNLHRDGEPYDEFAQLLGLGEWLGLSEENVDRVAIANQIREIRDDIEEKVHVSDIPEILAKNIDVICQLANLNEAERSVLAFAVLLKNCHTLYDNLRDFGDLPERRLIRVLAVLLGVDLRDVESAISPVGTLAQCGILVVKPSERGDIEDKF